MPGDFPVDIHRHLTHLMDHPCLSMSLSLRYSSWRQSSEFLHFRNLMFWALCESLEELGLCLPVLFYRISLSKIAFHQLKSWGLKIKSCKCPGSSVVLYQYTVVTNEVKLILFLMVSDSLGSLVSFDERAPLTSVKCDVCLRLMAELWYSCHPSTSKGTHDIYQCLAEGGTQDLLNGMKNQIHWRSCFYWETLSSDLSRQPSACVA